MPVQRATSGKHVFISHRAQGIDFAWDLKGRLEELGVPCWLDKAELGFGDQFSPELTSALEAAFAVVFIITEDVRERPTWIAEELTIADKLGIRRSACLLVPEGTVVLAGLNSQEQYYFLEPAIADESWTRLLKELADLCPVEAWRRPTAGGPPPRDQRRQRASAALVEDLRRYGAGASDDDRRLSNRILRIMSRRDVEWLSADLEAAVDDAVQGCRVRRRGDDSDDPILTIA